MTVQHLNNGPHDQASWTAPVEEVLTSDQAVAFAYVTPASGVVLLPLTNVALLDNEPGRVTPVSSSVGMWKKLSRLRENPQVAVAYHTRAHGFTTRPEFVLLQGHASLTPPEDHGWVEKHLENWERFSGPRDAGPIAERWLRAYHWRVGVGVDVERIVTWSDLACHGESQVYGRPLPEQAPAPQRPP